MKRANGTGCVTKLSGNRRKPWIARVTLGYDDEGKIKTKLLSDKDGNKYFENRTIPDLLLANWNIEKGNVKIDKSDYTFSQVFEEYKKKYFPTKEEIEIEKETHQKARGKLGKVYSSCLQTTYNHCKILHNKLYKSLRKDDFEKIILSATGSASTINRYAELFRKLDAYALEQDIIVKGYADLIKVSADWAIPSKTSIPYSYEEINEIWKDTGNIIADIILTTIYTGMRIEEVFITENKNVYLEEKYLISGIKTKAGKGRIIPIHHELLPIIKFYYNPEEKYLFEENNNRINYNTFRIKYNKYLEQLNMNHTTHDGRRTLHTELDRVGANKVCINQIFGHKSGDIGDDIYTKKSLEELKETIELVNFTNRNNNKITYLKLLG